MKQYWEYINDDKLNYLEQTVLFLTDEFSFSFGESPWSKEYFKWKLGNDNPAGPGFMSVAISNEKVVGTTTLTLKKALINGKEVLGGEMGDSFTSLAIRRGGLPLNLTASNSNPNSYINKSVFGRLAHETRIRAEKMGVKFIYGTPNMNAFPGWTKNLGYRELIDIKVRNYYRPTAKYVCTKFPIIKNIEGIIKFLDDSTVSFSRKIYKFNSLQTINFERPNEDELDALWVKCKPINGFSLIRDAQYWKHRYYIHPKFKYDTFVVRQNDDLTGILITKKLITKDGKLYIALVEWMGEGLVLNNNLLNEVLYHFKNSNIDLYYLFSSNSLFKMSNLRNKLFFSGSKIPVINPINNDSFDQTLFQDSFFYLGSTDAI